MLLKLLEKNMPKKVIKKGKKGEILNSFQLNFTKGNKQTRILISCKEKTTTALSAISR